MKKKNQGEGSPFYRVSKAPPPPTELSGRGGGISPCEKPTQIPPNPPAYFPNDLWPKTVVILAKARKEFPDHTLTLELCKRVISEMTPLFCEAVKSGKMKAGAVLTEGLGGMEDLLHSLLVYNDDGPHSGLSSLSDKAYRLGQEAINSDEWLKLAKAVAEAGERQAESQSRGRTPVTTIGQPVELGKGGVRFVRQGDYTVALPCGTGGETSDSSTPTAVRVSYDILCVELTKVHSIVKANGGGIVGAELRKQFRRSQLASVADEQDWKNWAEDFSPKNLQLGRPKGAALTFLERKMTLDRGTIKSYLSRSKKHLKREK